jgi:GntR family transcriptional regulator/MocR family aminotransferase
LSRIAAPLNFDLELGRGPRHSARPLAVALLDAIASGQLHDGDRLPSTRTLATSSRLPRSVVVAAYEELAAAGFLATRPGGGTYVEAGAAIASRAGAFGAALPRPTRPARVPARRISYDLRPGVADVQLIAERDWARAMRSAARTALAPDDTRQLLDRGAVRPSHIQLRRELVDHLRRARGLAVDPDDLFVFPSASRGLQAVAAATGLAGHEVAFEEPGYTKARLALQAAEVRVRPVAVDADGIRAADLRGRDRAVYVTPAHQFPLGGRMPASRRAELMAWATAHDALVLEDDYDGEFRYDVAAMVPLRAMPAGPDRVIYFGTSAKILSRALAVSWVVVPTRIRAAMTQYLDRTGDMVSTISTAVLTDLLATGAVTRHHARAMRTYGARQARFVTACRELIPAAQPLGIEAGLHVVLAFDAGPGRARLDDVAAVTALAEQGLLCAPLSAYYAAADSASMTGLVCGYARLPETRARAAATVIAEVLTALGRPTRPRRRAPRQTPGPPAPRGRTAAARRSG